MRNLARATIVLVTRHPDYSNEFETFVGDEIGVEIFDIDLGRSDLSNGDEYASWRESHEQDIEQLVEAGRLSAAAMYQDIIDSAGPDAS